MFNLPLDTTMNIKKYKDKKQKRESFGILPVAVTSIKSLRKIYINNRLTIPKIKKIWPHVMDSVFVGGSFIDKTDLQKIVPYKIVRKNNFFSDQEISDNMTEISLIIKLPDYLRLIFMSNLETVRDRINLKLNSHETIKVIIIRHQR